MMWAGVSKQEIPISLPVQLAGHKGVRIANEIKDDLFIRSLFLSNNNNSVALVSVELLWLDKIQIDYVRRKIARLLSISEHSIIITCTHTHSGPDTLDWYDFSPPVNQIWLFVVLDLIINTVIRSSKNMVAVSMHHIVDEIPIAINRRLKNESGIVKLEPNPQGKTSSRLIVFKFVNNRNKTIAVIYNHVAHPVVLGANSLCISGDWCGLTSQNIEESYNCLCIYFNGSSGDQNPVIWTGCKYSEMEMFCKQIVRVLDKNLNNSLLPTSNDKINVYSGKFGCTGKSHPYLTIAQKKRIFIDNSMIVQSSILYLGDWRIIFCPGECLIETGEELMSGFENIMIVSYANDYLGYLPMPKIYYEGGYEPYATMLTSSEVMQFIELSKQLLNQTLID